MQKLIEQIERTVEERVQQGAYSINVAFRDDVVMVRAYQDHHFTETFITPKRATENYDPEEAATIFAARQPTGSGMSIHRRGHKPELRRPRSSARQDETEAGEIPADDLERYGVKPLPEAGYRVTNEMVEQRQDELGI